MTRAFYITCDDKTEQGDDFSTEDIYAAFLLSSNLANVTVREVQP